MASSCCLNWQASIDEMENSLRGLFASVFFNQCKYSIIIFLNLALISL